MPIPIITPPQMREWERASWAAGIKEADVIRRVGKRVARRAKKMTRADDTILIVAGKGHNGDDARAAAKQMEGRRCKLLEMLLPDGDLVQLESALKDGPALIIDGLFGIGLNRQLGEAWRKIIHAINGSKVPVLSIDLPSGLNAATGETYGAVIEASVTLTVGAPKTGLYAPAAWPYVGRLEIADEVGLIACPFKTPISGTSPDDFAGYPPGRRAFAHKGDFGHLGIIAGSMGYHGAAVLAARGAQRAQPGLITVLTDAAVYAPVAGQLQSCMVDAWRPGHPLLGKCTALLIGPGQAAPDMADRLKAEYNQLWRQASHPIIADASALDLLEPSASKPPGARILTPHPGEAARLLETGVPDIQSNRPETLRRISQKFGGAWVVLKGQHTLIGQHGGNLFVNTTGNPYLAQGGSGDVLAGFIAGLLAQPALQTDVGLALRHAVWQHGATADQLLQDRQPWTVEDLASNIGDCR